MTSLEELRGEALRAARAAMGDGRGDAVAWRVDVRVPADAPDLRPALQAARAAVAEEFPSVRWKLRTQRAGAGTEVSISVHPLGAGARLQQRDRDLLALIALARALTTAQVATLLFPGLHRSVAHRRLRAFGVGTGRLVRDAYFVTREAARVQVWGLTASGYDVAEQVLGKTPPPRAELVRPQFLEHLVWLNELFVALATAHGAPVRPSELAFRWICDHDRPIQVPERGLDGARRDAVIAPDAILELPRARRRVFIEAERGTHTIVPVSITKTGATVAKVKRYDNFFARWSSGTRSVHIDLFGGGYEPTLLFVVHSQDRRERVRRAIEPVIRNGVQRGDYSVDVLTMSDATREYVRLLRRDVNDSAPTAAAVDSRGDAKTLREGFGALVRTIKAAGISVPAEEYRRVVALRALLESMEATGDPPSRPAQSPGRNPAPASRGPRSA